MHTKSSSNVTIQLKQDNKLFSKMKKHLKKRRNIKTTVTYQSKKLGIKFQLKDKTNFHQQDNLVYYSKCSDKKCNGGYVGKQIEKLRKRLSTTTNMKEIPSC